METSLSSSSYASPNTYYAKKEDNGTRVSQNYLSDLHSTRKQPSKPWKKPSVSPTAPTQPRVYKVDPIDFRELVQKLTGAPRLQNPDATNVVPVSQSRKAVPVEYRDFLLETGNDNTSLNALGNSVALDSLEFDLSPFLSPRSLARW